MGLWFGGGRMKNKQILTILNDGSLDSCKRIELLKELLEVEEWK